MITKLPDTNPIVVALEAEKKKAQDLHRRRQEHVKELEPLLEARRQSRQLGSGGRLEREATALLDGGSAEHVEFSRIEELQHDIAVIDKAIEKHKQNIDKADRLYSRAMNDANERNFLEIQREMRTAERVLGTVYQKERAFLEGLRDAGVKSIRFQPMAYGRLGLPSDPQSAFNMREREFSEVLRGK